MRITRVVDQQELNAAADLFDNPLREPAAGKFLDGAGHHLLLAYADTSASPVGFVSGVEMTHPDKGTEMFLYELGVTRAHRRRGVATALVRALADLAEQRGCYGMWVAVDAENHGALATYRSAGADAGSLSVIQSWRFDRTPGDTVQPARASAPP